MALISPLQMDSFERSTLWIKSAPNSSLEPQASSALNDDTEADDMSFSTETLPPLHYHMSAAAGSSYYHQPSPYHYHQRPSPYAQSPYYTSNVRDSGASSSTPPYSSMRSSPAMPLPMPHTSRSPSQSPSDHRLSTSSPTSSSPTPSPPVLSSGMPRLPPIFQVEKQQVTTQATQAASASRRRNDASFKCPVPGCGSTFTRRFNLRGHLRSHTEERPFVCEWAGCGKGFARQHDCKRHQALHSSKAGQFTCDGCGKPFSRMDALNRHLRSEGGLACKQKVSDEASEYSADGESPRHTPN